MIYILLSLPFWNTSLWFMVFWFSLFLEQTLYFWLWFSLFWLSLLRDIKCLTLINVLWILLFLKQTLFASLWFMFFWFSLLLKQTLYFDSDLCPFESFFLEQILYVWLWFISFWTFFWKTLCTFDYDSCCFDHHYFWNIEWLTLINVLIFLEQTLFTSIQFMFFWFSLFLEQALYFWLWFMSFWIFFRNKPCMFISECLIIYGTNLVQLTLIYVVLTIIIYRTFNAWLWLMFYESYYFEKILVCFTLTHILLSLIIFETNLVCLTLIYVLLGLFMEQTLYVWLWFMLFWLSLFLEY